jgi:hypothetical protein
LNNAICSWELDAGAGYLPVLEFTSFDLDDGFDFIDIYDPGKQKIYDLGKQKKSRDRLRVTATESTPHLRLTGDSKPAIISVMSSKIIVEFRSDSLFRSRGFEASFTSHLDHCKPGVLCDVTGGDCVEDQCICKLGFFGANCAERQCVHKNVVQQQRPLGQIRNMHPSELNYANHKHCTWEIRPPKLADGTLATELHLNWTTFDLESNSLNGDYVRIDGCISPYQSTSEPNPKLKPNNKSKQGATGKKKGGADLPSKTHPASYQTCRVSVCMFNHLHDALTKYVKTRTTSAIVAAKERPVIQIIHVIAIRGMSELTVPFRRA